jgi:excisionase family DNA binding protein
MRPSVSPITTAPVTTAGMTEEEMLAFYLSLPKKARDERFVSTAGTAELAGLSVRTIQFWIESGALRAVPVGRKYRVDVDSLREYLTSQASKRLR